MIEIATALALGVMGQYVQDFALSDARGWVQEHHSEVLQHFLPINNYRVMAARSFETLVGEIPEQWFCIDFHEDGGFIAEARLPDKQPIADQLAWGHLSDPQKPFETMLQSVRIQRTIVTDSQCHGLRTILKRFPSLRPQFELGGTLTIHTDPRVWEVQTRGRERILYVSDTDRESPVTVWFQRSLAQILSCGSSAPPEARTISVGSLAADARCGIRKKP